MYKTCKKIIINSYQTASDPDPHVDQGQKQSDKN